MRPPDATTLAIATLAIPPMATARQVSTEGMAFSRATIRIRASGTIDCFYPVHPRMTGKITAR